MLTFRVFLRRARVRRRRGIVLADLLLASVLALWAAIIVLQSTSMLVRQNSAAKEHRDEAYAFAALIEEALGASESGFVGERMGWKVEAEPSGMHGAYAPSSVKITDTRTTRGASFAWESWRERGR